MRAIIMAAGIGSRLRGISGDRPKCLIQAGEETLLRRMIRQLREARVDDICVITGYKSALIHKELPLGVHLIHNPFYSVTNSIASLWLARELLTEETLLMNADLYFEPEVLDIALDQVRPAVMLSDHLRIKTADFRFQTLGNSIVAASKQLSDQETDCEYVGIVRLDGSFIEVFRQRLEEMVKSGCFSDWWEAALYSFLGGDVDIVCADVKGAFWTEVDHAGDYARLKDWLSRKQANPLEEPGRDLAGTASHSPS